MTRTMDQLREQVSLLAEALTGASDMGDERYGEVEYRLADVTGLAVKALHEWQSPQADDPQADSEAAKHMRVGTLLLNNAPPPGEGGEWPWLTALEGAPADKRSANKFFLGAIIDYQQSADRAWQAAREYAEGQLNDPDDLWPQIAAIPADEWNSDEHRSRCGLHRFKQAHKRVHDIAVRIVERYDGDVRNLWLGQNRREVLARLNQISAGKELSKMIAGALYDTGQIEDFGDLKADLQVCRVLGRVFTGAPVVEAEAHRIASAIAPLGSWIIDEPLYVHGREVCTADPNCSQCYLWYECEYFARAQS